MHALVLSGRVQALADVYPGDAGPVALEALNRHAGFVLDRLESPPQTNEVARSAMLAPGFHQIARETGLPLALYELGSSAGLNLNWDHYSIRLGETEFGDASSPVRLAPKMRAKQPETAPAEIISRRGVDRAPIDVTNDADRLRLAAYIWPDQAERHARTAAALDLAGTRRPMVDEDDAGTWTAEALATRPADAATVLFHSVVWQYLPERSQAEIEEALERSGRVGPPLA